MHGTVHQGNRLSGPCRAGNVHGAFCLPLHQFSLVGVEEDAPIFEGTLEDLFQLFFTSYKHQVEVGRFLDPGEVPGAFRGSFCSRCTAQHLLHGLVQ